MKKRLEAVWRCYLLRQHGYIFPEPLDSRDAYLWRCELCGKTIWIG